MELALAGDVGVASMSAGQALLASFALVDDGLDERMLALPGDSRVRWVGLGHPAKTPQALPPGLVVASGLSRVVLGAGGDGWQQ